MNDDNLHNLEVVVIAILGLATTFNLTLTPFFT